MSWFRPCFQRKPLALRSDFHRQQPWREPQAFFKMGREPPEFPALSQIFRVSKGLDWWRLVLDLATSLVRSPGLQSVRAETANRSNKETALRTNLREIIAVRLSASTWRRAGHCLSCSVQGPRLLQSSGLSTAGQEREAGLWSGAFVVDQAQVAG